MGEVIDVGCGFACRRDANAARISTAGRISTQPTSIHFDQMESVII
jgi:hypothetical protein